MSPLLNLTPRPPLGWNSFDSFGCKLNEKRLLEILDVFVERLQPHGYEYLVVDAGWYRHHEMGDEEFPRTDEYSVWLDDHGRPRPAPCFFPNGFTDSIETCHDAGVKFGIHMHRGIPRDAVKADMPIKNTSRTASDIADTTDTCPWCPDNYGIDVDQPGAQEYYDSLIDLYADWGVDFIKYDDIVPYPDEVNAVVNAIESHERDIVLSLSPGDEHDPDGWDAYYRANMLRITGDIWDEREGFERVFNRWEAFQEYAEEAPDGFWLDQDMIPFGELQINRGRPQDEDGNPLMSGRGRRRMSMLNEPQKRTFITMRALGASPLFMGGNLTETDGYSFQLLTDPDMLACNQNGITGHLIEKTDTTCTWKTPHRSISDAGWFGIFNRDPDGTRTVKLDCDTLGIEQTCSLYDVWNERELSNLTEPIEITLSPDDVLFVCYGKDRMR